MTIFRNLALSTMTFVLLASTMSAFGETAHAESHMKATAADEAAYDKVFQLVTGHASDKQVLEKLKRQSLKYKSQLPSLYCRQNHCRDFASIELHTLTDAHAEGALTFDRAMMISALLRQEHRYSNSVANELGLFVLTKQILESSKAKPENAKAVSDWDAEVRNWEQELFDRVQTIVRNGTPSNRLSYLIAGMNGTTLDPQWLGLRRDLHKSSEIDLAVFTNQGKEQVRNNPKIAADLVNVEPDIAKYRSGRYVGTPRIFMFCRMNRQYPCMTLIKNKDGKLHRDSAGKPFAHPSLGYSRHEKEFNERNGNTPSGVFQIDSVMPEADKTMVFGKFRRMILNLIPSSPDEVNYKFLLPPSSHQATWWKETVVARDVGRGAFRIHGTGLRSSSGNPFYPFVATSGCVAQRENKYGKTEFVDQRILLDELMKAYGLEPKVENEPKIRGLLYVVNIDSRKAAVTLDDLKKYGIIIEE